MNAVIRREAVTPALDRPWLSYMTQRGVTAASLLWEALEQTEQALSGSGSAEQRIKQARRVNQHARAVAACIRGYTRQMAEELA